MTGENKTVCPVEEPHLSVILDSNAIRSLGQLEDEKWNALLASWHTRELATAWVPWTIAEVVGSNLCRKDGLSDADLAAVVRAVRRFDELASGSVLPDSEEIVRRSFYSLAGVAPPPSPRADADREPQRWRDVLDVAKEITSTDLIEFENKPGRRCVVLKRRDNPTAGFEIALDAGFEDSAKERLEFWRKRTKCSRGAQTNERVLEIVQFVPEFARAAAFAPNIGVPLDIAARAVLAGSHFLDSPLGYRHVIEGWYFHLRATGDKSSIENNDMGDMAIASYMPFAWQFVTDDENLRRLLRGVLKPGSNQVIGFVEFVNAVRRSSL